MSWGKRLRTPNLDNLGSISSGRVLFCGESLKKEIHEKGLNLHLSQFITQGIERCECIAVL